MYDLIIIQVKNEWLEDHAATDLITVGIRYPGILPPLFQKK